MLIYIFVSFSLDNYMKWQKYLNKIKKIKNWVITENLFYKFFMIYDLMVKNNLLLILFVY